MEVPAGAEFAEPRPPHRNHFSNVFVLHRASRTVHNDDCVIAISPGGIGLTRVLYPSFKPSSMHFHPCMCTVGLNPTPEAPAQFKAWFSKLLDEWDFENLCTAHNGNIYGDAKERLRALLESKDSDLRKLAAKNAARVAEDRMLKAWSATEGAAAPDISKREDCDCWGNEDEVECG
jgi:hypothetical protein